MNEDIEADTLHMVDTNSFTAMRRTYPRGPFPQVWELMEQLTEEGRLLSIELVLDELNVSTTTSRRGPAPASNLFVAR